MKIIKATQFYNNLGQLLCSLAGGIIGFIIGDIQLIIPGLFMGAFTGSLLEKHLSPAYF